MTTAARELFEEITRLDEYYPTRTETAILRDNAQAIADFCGAEAVLIEYGARRRRQNRDRSWLRWPRPRLYVPIDISADFSN